MRYAREIENIIKRKLPRSQLVPSDTGFKFIRGKQAWLDLKCENKAIILSLEPRVLFLGVGVSGGIIKIFDFGEDYRQIEREFDIRITSLTMTKVVYNKKEYLFFSNYPVFGSFWNNLNTVHNFSDVKLKEHWISYGLDFYIWLSGIAFEVGRFSVNFAIVPSGFVFKGPFLEHNIKPGDDHLKISSLITLLDVLWEFKKRNFYFDTIKNFFYSETELLDYLDVNYFKPGFKEKGLDYEPSLRLRDYNYRLKKIVEKLKGL